MLKVKVTWYPAENDSERDYRVKTEGPQDPQAITKVIQEALESYLAYLERENARRQT